MLGLRRSTKESNTETLPSSGSLSSEGASQINVGNGGKISVMIEKSPENYGTIKDGT